MIINDDSRRNCICISFFFLVLYLLCPKQKLINLNHLYRAEHLQVATLNLKLFQNRHILLFLKLIRITKIILIICKCFFFFPSSSFLFIFETNANIYIVIYYYYYCYYYLCFILLFKIWINEDAEQMPVKMITISIII